jgi:hypothetical protein
MQASSVYPWAQYPPGVTYNGGIPARTTQCGPTLMPLGGGQSDAAQIRAAIVACPAGQHVQLGAGVFIVNANIGESINIGYNPVVNNVTLRGVGPGPGGAIPAGQTAIPTESQCGSTPCTIIFNNGWQNGSGSSILNINNGGVGVGQLGTSVNLAQDALQGSTTLVLASIPNNTTQAFYVGALAVVDMLTTNSTTGASLYPDVMNLTPAFFEGQPTLCTDGCVGWFSTHPFRYQEQVVKITAINGNTVTIDKPLAISMLTAYRAQFTTFIASTNMAVGLGIEDIYFYGGTGGQGNINMELCQGCWFKHIESHYKNGPDHLGSCYQCEVRDSYIHESGNQAPGQSIIPSPGGNGYGIALAWGSFGNLIENNIIWWGDKTNVVQTGGGGNVIAYNYMDDTYNYGDPIQPEAGVNDSHYIGSHMDLIEGNWSHELSGDSWWGNSTYLTVFRNQLSALRSANPPVNAIVQSGEPYCDCITRGAVFLQSRSDWYNFVGNVLGFSGQTLLNGALWPQTPSFTATQTSWGYEDLTGNADGSVVVYMWTLGNGQANGPSPDPTQYQRVNRQGNFDWVTKSQIWYSGVGGSGTTSTGSPQTIPNSMYVTSKPAFFGTLTWPWVDPSTGATYTLPAKARFDAGTPNAAVGGAAPLQ